MKPSKGSAEARGPDLGQDLIELFELEAGYDPGSGRWIGHKPFWLRQFHRDGDHNENKVQHRHACAKSLLQLPAAKLDAADSPENHPKKEACVEHEVRRFDHDPGKLRVVRFNPALDEPWDWQPDLQGGSYT